MIDVEIEYLNADGWQPQNIILDVDKDMALSDETLDGDMCALPKLISYYAEIAAECHAKAARKKNSMEVEEATIAQAIRAGAKVSGDKITEPAIKEKVLESISVTAARVEYYDADRQYRMMDGFYRALRDKATLAIALCYKQKEEIRVNNSPLI